MEFACMKGAYQLNLHCIGEKGSKITVFDSEDAVGLYRSFITRFGLGASDLAKDSGKVMDENGKHICSIAYNGRVVLPNGQFVDGMSGQDWMALCAS